ncbi:tetratricopeptide repeat protein [Nocardia sp. NPDC051833]|uniref:tetratricopeptide repeat protein n=1 Tax=Nocardia sp. NPDC051833 TaxID=3155674 RepID=UPI0034427ACB
MSDHHLDRAAALIDLGRFEAARAELAPLLAAEPDNGDAHAQLAYSWLRSGDTATAAESARTALRLDPENVFAWKLLALSEHGLLGELYESDRPAALAHEDAATRAASRCVELDPWSAECHRILATVVVHRDRKAAMAAIDTAVELEPANAVLHVVRGRVLWQGAKVASQRAAAGRAALAEALRLDPDNVEALFLLGSHAVQRRRWAEAETWLRRAAELDPSYAPEVRELLARIPDPAADRASSPERESSTSPPAPALAAAAYPPMPPDPAWRQEYLGARGSGGGAGGWAVIGVVVLLVILAALGATTENPDSPSTGPASRTLPSYYRPPSYIPLPRTFPQFPADRLPTGYPWPTTRPRVTLPPNWVPPTGN